MLVASTLPTRNEREPGSSRCRRVARAGRRRVRHCDRRRRRHGSSRCPPIADDLVVNAKVAHLHGPLPAFGSWMTSWTGYYSEYGLLTALAGIARAFGIDRFTFAIASVAFLALLVASVRGCVDHVEAPRRHRLGLAGGHCPHRRPARRFRGPAEGLAAHESLRGDLLGERLDVASGPRRRLPTAHHCGPANTESRRVHASSAFVGGLFIAGFGLVESVVVTAIVCACAWVASRLCGRQTLSNQRPTLTAARSRSWRAAAPRRAHARHDRARDYFQSIHLGLARTAVSQTSREQPRNRVVRRQGGRPVAGTGARHPHRSRALPRRSLAHTPAPS